MAVNSMSPVIVVEIDAVAGVFRIMNAPGASVQKARVKEFPLSEDKLRRGQYSQALDETLPAVSPLFRQLRSFSLTLILPASLLAFDILTIPTMTKSQMESAFKAEIKNQYKNAQDLTISSQILYTNKKSTAYLLSVTKKSVIDEIRGAFARHSMPISTMTFQPVSAAYALFGLRPKVKKDNVLLVDVRKNSTLLVLSEKERILGFSELAFGQNILKDSYIVEENTINGDEAAVLAVLNAKESARAKQLTKSLGSINDMVYEEDETESSEASFADTEELSVVTGEVPAVDAENLSEEEMLKLIGELQTEDSSSNGGTKQREGRHLPRFMHREMPTEPHDFIYENFRYILKRVLLFARQCRMIEGMPEPDYVVLNLPLSYAFLIGMVNAEEDSHMKFMYFDPSVEKNDEVTGHLSAYGGYLAGSFKGQQVL